MSRTPKRGKATNEIEIAEAIRDDRCVSCHRVIGLETWTAETAATYEREARCPKCGPAPEDER